MATFDTWLSRAGNVASLIGVVFAVGAGFGVYMMSQPDWAVAVTMLGSGAGAYLVSCLAWHRLQERDRPAADTVRRHVDKGGLDRLPEILNRGEYLQRVLGKARRELASM